MKKHFLLLIGAAIAALFVSGCAKDQVTVQPGPSAGAESAIINLRTLEATARIREAEAEKELASKLDAGGAAAALMARYLGKAAPAPAQVVQPQQPQSVLGAAWHAILQVADVALRGYGIKTNRDVAIRTSDNNRDVTLAGYSAFTTLGGHIRDAGIAGYPYVQAPGAVTSNTIGGDGVIGAGTFTGAVTNTTTTTTTTRNCNGGSGAPGSVTGTTTPSATGGAAPGGNC